MTVKLRRPDQKKIRHKDARGRYSATVVKVMNIGNHSMQKKVSPGKDQKMAKKL